MPIQSNPKLFEINDLESMKPETPDNLPDFTSDACADLLLHHQQTHTKQGIVDHLDRHVLGVFTYRDDLKKCLQQACYWLGLESFDVNLKAKIALRILEGLDLCTPGFYNRVAESLLALNIPKTLNHLLYNLRVSLVERAAFAQIAELTPEESGQSVHIHNDFFNTAQGKYGVIPLNPGDPYSGGLGESVIMTELDNLFDAEYQSLWPLLNGLRSQCEQALVSDYTSRKTPESGGYTVGEYQAFINFFKPIVPNLGQSDLLITNEDGYDEVIDINWPLIKLELYQALIDEGYFSVPSSEHTHITRLLSEEPLDPSAFQTLNDLNLDFVLSLDSTSITYQKELILGYLQHRPHDELSHYPLGKQAIAMVVTEKKAQAKLIELLNQLIEENAIAFNAESFAEISNIDAFNHPFYEAIVNKQSNLLAFLLKIVQSLTPDEQTRVLTKPFSAPHHHLNPLMMAVAFSDPVTIVSIFNVIESLNPTQQQTILTQNLQNQTIWSCALLTKNPEIINISFSKLQTRLSAPALSDMIKNVGAHRIGSLFYLIDNPDSKLLQSVYNQLKPELQQALLQQTSAHKNTILECALKKNDPALISFFLNEMFHHDLDALCLNAFDQCITRQISENPVHDLKHLFNALHQSNCTEQIVFLFINLITNQFDSIKRLDKSLSCVGTFSEPMQQNIVASFLQKNITHEAKTTRLLQLMELFKDEQLYKTYDIELPFDFFSSDKQAYDSPFATAIRNNHIKQFDWYLYCLSKFTLKQQESLLTAEDSTGASLLLAASQQEKSYFVSKLLEFISLHHTQDQQAVYLQHKNHAGENVLFWIMFIELNYHHQTTTLSSALQRLLEMIKTQPSLVQRTILECTNHQKRHAYSLAMELANDYDSYDSLSALVNIWLEASEDKESLMIAQLQFAKTQPEIKCLLKIIQNSLSEEKFTSCLKYAFINGDIPSAFTRSQFFSQALPKVQKSRLLTLSDSNAHLLTQTLSLPPKSADHQAWVNTLFHATAVEHRGSGLFVGFAMSAISTSMQSLSSPIHVRSNIATCLRMILSDTQLSQEDKSFLISWVGLISEEHNVHLDDPLLTPNFLNQIKLRGVVCTPAQWTTMARLANTPEMLTALTQDYADKLTDQDFCRAIITNQALTPILFRRYLSEANPSSDVWLDLSEWLQRQQNPNLNDIVIFSQKTNDAAALRTLFQTYLQNNGSKQTLLAALKHAASSPLLQPLRMKAYEFILNSIDYPLKEDTYINAATSAFGLYRDLERSPLDNTVDIRALIQPYRTVLEQHRGIKQILCDIIDAIGSLFCIQKLSSTSRLRLFKTNAAQLVDNLEHQLLEEQRIARH